MDGTVILSPTLRTENAITPSSLSASSAIPAWDRHPGRVFPAPALAHRAHSADSPGYESTWMTGLASNRSARHPRRDGLPPPGTSLSIFRGPTTQLLYRAS